ncbi:hypothetical protein P9453_06860 [Enterobacter bugandensis]|uniref:hypothetical protein n=1 Tax=Enterobacter bugandensis TaxID=881260 RepID=UPI00398B6196
MPNDNLKNTAKNGLPLVIASVLCGYATNAIPILFPAGETREWAYRSIPFLSIIILFIIKTLKDFGGMSFSNLVFTICASSEKKRLLAMINDSNLSQATRDDAKKRYDEIGRQELELGSRFLKYVSQWSVINKSPTPPPTD